MMLLVHKKTKRVRAITEGVIDYDKEKFDLLDFIPSKKEQESIDRNDILRWDKGLKTELSPHIVNNNKQKKIIEIYNKVEGNNLTQAKTKEVLQEILDLIK